MKNIKNKLKTTGLYPVCLLCAITWLVSSCDYLNIDQYFDDELKLDSVFSQKRYVEDYMWGAAALFPDESNIFGDAYTPGPCATDEAFTLFSFPGTSFVLGAISPSNLSSMNTWGNLYKIIRKCNTIMTRINETADLTTSDRIRILGYTRFIRAYAYYNILVDFGPPILLGDEVIENNEAIEYYDRPRSTYDEAMEYVCSELEQAAVYLPLKNSILDFGRPTKGAAYGLVARLRLTHASPLYNGGDAARRYFGSWTRKTDNVHYVSQTYDEKRWAIAAAAAKRVMDLSDAGAPLYNLYTVSSDNNTPTLPVNVTSDPAYYQTYPNGAAGIDPYRSYSEIFNGEAIASVNPEFVWARNSSAMRDFGQHYFPATAGGWNGLCVTQKVVDAYRMKDGRTIDNASTNYPYSETGFSTGLPAFSGYRFTSTGEVYNMYVNREPRFYTSVGFSECFWPCSSTTESGLFNLTATYYYGAANGKGGSLNSLTDYPITGYVSKKYVHPNDAWKGSGHRRTDKTFPIIRYAEILLSYAEALNNLTASHTVEMDDWAKTFTRNTEEIKKAFNQVRYRAGLPGLSDAELANPQQVQALIEQERMVEFLHENRRYYDVRRWGIYEETENEPIRGMNADAPKEGFYQRVIPNTSRIGSRIVNRKMVFLPIPKNEIQRLPSFDQNPGWNN